MVCHNAILPPNNFDLDICGQKENVMAEAYIWQCEPGTCIDHL